MSLPSAMVLKKLGFKNGMVAGLIVVIIGSLLFSSFANWWHYIKRSREPWKKELASMTDAAARNEILSEMASRVQFATRNNLLFVAMSFSSVSVILNSLRLRTAKIDL